jgi:4'-phosphopantetheinyl transferase
MLIPAEGAAAGERQMINNAVADEWDHSSGDIDLSADEVHIWRASPNQDAEAIANLVAFLSQGERQRAMRYRHPADRDRFIAGRGILRKIISAYLALPPSELRFSYGE